MRTRFPGLALGLALVACARPGPSKQCVGAAPLESYVFGGQRPVTLDVPTNDDPSCPMPLVLLLHGYGASGELQKVYFNLLPLVDAKRVLLAAPDGTKDSTGARFWNATEACCNVDHVQVDDVAYLKALIEEIAAAHAVDRTRVYAVGHSNGGFMAYRLACEHAGMLAAVVSLAGATFLDPARCTPQRPVSVLQIHGTKDGVIQYDGGAGWYPDGGADPPYPSAAATTDTWARYDGCSTQTTSAASVDLEGTLPGNETTVLQYQGCPSGILVERWTIEEGSHVPSPSRTFVPTLWRWLDQARQPGPP